MHHHLYDLSIGWTRYIEHRIPTVLRGPVDGRMAHQLLLHFERQTEFRQACPVSMPEGVPTQLRQADLRSCLVEKPR
jgi:hypothetical protein